MALRKMYEDVLLTFLFTIVVVSSKKNVLFIISDDLRAQLGVYNGPNFATPVHTDMYTPNIDALASRSLLLKRAYVQQALCSPSRSSFLTGRRPDTTHVYDLVSSFRHVGGNFTTLPQFFKQKGYKTYGIGKIFHGKNASGGDDTPSWTEPYFHGDDPYFRDRNFSWEAVPDSELQTKPLVDRQIADHAIQTLRSISGSVKKGETDFFMAVGFRRPHLPFVFPDSVMQTHYPKHLIRLPSNPYAPVNMPNISWSSYDELRIHYGDIKALNLSGEINTTLPDQITLDLRRAYYSAVTWIDSLVGEVIRELDSLGLSNNTVVSFIGDHGWQLGEHGEWCKHTNFEITTHAPMMIHIPGLTDHGIVTEQLTEFVDLYPTIVEAAGHGSLPLCPEDSVNTKICREGTSLLPLIIKPDTAIKHTAFSQFRRPGNIMGYSMRTNRYRYTEWVDFKYAPTYKANWDIKHGVELYDHNVDPEENYNGADDPKYHDIKTELSKLLHKGWRHTPDVISEIIG